MVSRVILSVTAFIEINGMTCQYGFALPKEIVEQIAKKGVISLPGLINTKINAAILTSGEENLKADLYRFSNARRDEHHRRVY